MADGKPEGLSDEEWAAVTAHRRDSAPKRKGTGRYTDEAGISYEFELTPEETAKLASKALTGLFTSGDDDEGQDGGKKKPPAKPAVLRDYFGAGKKAAGGS